MNKTAKLRGDVTSKNTQVELGTTARSEETRNEKRIRVDGHP